VSQALEDVFYPQGLNDCEGGTVLGRTSSDLGEIDFRDDFKGPY
jgi:hypothetical protein